MAKGQPRSGSGKRKPAANAKKKSAGLVSPEPLPSPPPAANEPSEMYKLFTRNRAF